MATVRADQLDYVLVSVNGKSRMVRAGDELPVIRGDTVSVAEAVLVGRKPIKDVNVLGLHGPKNDDRGVSFKTDKLMPRYSEGDKGEVYAIMANAKKQLAGVVYLRLIDPVLRYAEISVNGKKHVLRDGEALDAKAKDIVKVESVKTNLEGTSDVIFQIVPTPEVGADRYEIRFLRAGQPFARIPLKLERG